MLNLIPIENFHLCEQYEEVNHNPKEGRASGKTHSTTMHGMTN